MNSNNIKILLTGGAGYIGSHTCVALIEAGFTPVVLDNLFNSNVAVLDRVKQITGGRPLFYQGDVRDRELLQTIFREHEIAGVIHFAGLKAVGESVKKPLAYYDVNVGGSLILAEEMARAGVTNLIFSSSATVYGDKNTVPFTEDMPKGQPTNPYGMSKLMVEQCLTDLYLADNSWSISLLRYFNPVGAHSSGLIGEDPQGIPNNLMPFITQVAVGRRECLSIFGGDYPTPAGTCRRDYIHVTDLADGPVAALTHKLNNPGLHTYNLGTGNGASVLDVVKVFNQVCPNKVPYKIVPRRQGDIADCWSDATKAKRELHWQAQYTLFDMVRDAWHWQSNNPYGYSNDKGDQ